MLMSSEGTPAFSVAPDTLPTIITLVLTTAALIFSVILFCLDKPDRYQSRDRQPSVYNTFVRNHDPPARSDTVSQVTDVRNGTPPVDSPPSTQPQRAKKSSPLRLSTLCKTVVDLCLASTLLASAALTIYLLLNIIRQGPLISLAQPATNQWLFSVIRSTISAYANTTGRVELHGTDVRIGLSSTLIVPGQTYQPDLWRWALIVFAFLIFIVLGVLLSFFKRNLPISRPIGTVMLLQLVVWIGASLASAFATPSHIPLDGTLLKNHWLDAKFSFSIVNEGRMLGNFYISWSTNNTSNMSNIDTFPNITSTFCTQFRNAVPTELYQRFPFADSDENGDEEASESMAPVPSAMVSTSAIAGSENSSQQSSSAFPGQSTEAGISGLSSPSYSSMVSSSAGAPSGNGEDFGDRPETPQNVKMDIWSVSQRSSYEVDESMMNEVFMVYLIGKPGGIDHFRAISYMSIAILVAMPIFVTQLFHSYVLYPFISVWVCVLCVLSVILTPSLLRALSWRSDHEGVVRFCGDRLRVDLMDKDTALISGMDMSVFVITVLVVVLNALQWFKVACKNESRL